MPTVDIVKSVKRVQRLHAFDVLGPEPRRPRPSKLAPYQQYLLRRLAQGESNTKQLLQDLRRRGFSGGPSSLKNFLQPFRISKADFILWCHIENPEFPMALSDMARSAEILLAFWNFELDLSSFLHLLIELSPEERVRFLDDPATIQARQILDKVFTPLFLEAIKSAAILGQLLMEWQHIPFLGDCADLQNYCDRIVKFAQDKGLAEDLCIARRFRVRDSHCGRIQGYYGRQWGIRAVLSWKLFRAGQTHAEIARRLYGVGNHVTRERVRRAVEKMKLLTQDKQYCWPSKPNILFEDCPRCRAGEAKAEAYRTDALQDQTLSSRDRAAIAEKYDQLLEKFRCPSHKREINLGQEGQTPLWDDLSQGVDIASLEPNPYQILEQKESESEEIGEEHDTN